MTATDRESTAGVLPVADRAQVRRAALELIRFNAGSFTATVTLTGLAAAAGLASPWLLGRIINDIQARAPLSAIDRLAGAVVSFAFAQLVLTRYGELVGRRFGERVQSRIREQFMDRVLAIPAGLVERTGTGDLAARGTGDISAIGASLRDAGPVVIIAALQGLFIFVAVFLASPLLGLCGLVGLLGIVVSSVWYLRRARDAYLAQGAASSVLAEQLTASVRGARTIEALGLQEQRRKARQDAVSTSRQTQTRTLFLRSVLYPSVDISYVIPVVLILVVGGVLHDHRQLSTGAVVAAALYMRQLSQPLDTILVWVEQLQSSGASFARVEGLASVARQEPSTNTSIATPEGDRIEADGVHYAYTGGVDVLSAVSLTVEPGERLALVGPSGAGKTTLGRLLAGIDRPRIGSVTIGQVPIADLAPESLRQHVLLITEEQHLFVGTIRDNLLLAAPNATDDQLHQALGTVEASWVLDLPEGLNTNVGSSLTLDAAQIQQLALARVILADPHTVILDEATALMDPTSARRIERALANVLQGRTVIAIAHRLHTAHAADRVALIQEGASSRSVHTTHCYAKAANTQRCGTPGVGKPIAG
ncbi:MAG TPA: ABC transporter ATP-binding protein [Acidothermaceae bacterium]